MVKKGDTLIEVALAVGIFSMIAISIVSVMSSGTSGAQLALETTLAREEVDAQAETLRFVHNTFSSNKENTDQALSNLWKTITSESNVIDLSTVTCEGKSQEECQESILQYSPQSCEEIYDANTNPVYNYAFVINPRAVNEPNSKAYIALKNSDNVLTQASTYPRFIFGDSNSDSSASLFGLNQFSNLYKAEGIYVIAVKDSGTNIVDITNSEQGSVIKSAYYDFYIRTCWYGTGNNEPSTISTVIRLHDSGVAAVLGWVDVKFETRKTSPINEGRAIQKRTYELTTPERLGEDKIGFVFSGWCDGEVTTDADENDTCHGNLYPGGDVLYNDVSDGVISYTLKDTWEHPKYTIKYDLNSPSISSNIPSTNCYLDIGCQVYGEKPTGTGYAFQGWCATRTNADGTCPSQILSPGDMIDPTIILNNSSNRIFTLYAVWSEFNEKITLELSWGATPRDLDSHVHGQKSDGSYFDTDYQNKTYSENFSEPIASLDKDVTSGYGIETVTLNTLGGKTYYYYIYNWTENSNITGATVKMTNQTTGEIRIYDSSSASGNGRYWNVFAYKDGQIINRNTRSGSPEFNY